MSPSSVLEMEGMYTNRGASFFEDVSLVEFKCPVLARIPGGVTVDDLGLPCCVPCLLSAISSLCSLGPPQHRLGESFFVFVFSPDVTLCG